MKDRQIESSYVATDDKSENIVSKVFYAINNLSALVQKFYFEHKDEIDAKIEEIRESDKHKSISTENVDMAIREQHIRESERKQTAKEIYKQVDEWRKSPELDPRDSYDCNALDAYNNVCKFINRKYGVQLEDTV